MRDTASLDLHRHASTTLDVPAFIDTDYAGCLDTRASMSGFTIYLSDTLIS